MKITIFLRIGVVLFLFFTMASCQGKFMSDQGRVVAEEKRIALQQEGSESGSWQGKKDLTVNYTATRNQDILQMAGDILLKKHKKLVSFQFSLVLIDADGQILDIVPVTTAGGRQKIEQIAFSREVTLPPGTSYFTFTYDGTTSGIGQGGSPKSFWSGHW